MLDARCSGLRSSSNRATADAVWTESCSRGIKVDTATGVLSAGCDISLAGATGSERLISQQVPLISAQFVGVEVATQQHDGAGPLSTLQSA